ncbi:MAG TPA: TNT domain-containing protein [Amycolatopsis sp.]|nr:TNT domain-containing protein [Amycolatopsis sp.]
MVTPTTQLNATEQDTLVKQIGLALLRAAPPDWRRVSAQYRAVGRYHELTGEILTEDGTVREWTATHDIAALFGRLRAGMYREGRGTWFNARYQLDHPSSYNLEYDRDEPRWNLAAPPQAYADELRMFPRADENVPEWLLRRTSGPAPEPAGPRFRVARIFDGQDAGGRPVLNRQELDSDELDRLFEYLSTAPVVLSERGLDLDRLAPAPVPKVPVAFHTDGVWIWPAAVNFYLQEYNVAPESELVAHVRSTGYSLPEVPDHTLQAAAAQLGRGAPPPIPPRVQRSMSEPTTVAAPVAPPTPEPEAPRQEDFTGARREEFTPARPDDFGATRRPEDFGSPRQEGFASGAREDAGAGRQEDFTGTPRQEGFSPGTPGRQEEFNATRQEGFSPGTPARPEESSSRQEGFGRREDFNPGRQEGFGAPRQDGFGTPRLEEFTPTRQEDFSGPQRSEEFTPTRQEGFGSAPGEDAGPGRQEDFTATPRQEGFAPGTPGRQEDFGAPRREEFTPARQEDFDSPQHPEDFTAGRQEDFGSPQHDEEPEEAPVERPTTFTPALPVDSGPPPVARPEPEPEEPETPPAPDEAHSATRLMSPAKPATAPPPTEPVIETMRRRLDDLGVSSDAYRIGEPADQGWSMEKIDAGWRVGWYDQELTNPAVFGDAEDAAAFMLGKLLLAHRTTPPDPDETPITGLRSDRHREEPPVPEPPSSPPGALSDRLDEPEPPASEPTMLTAPVSPPPAPPAAPPAPPAAPRREAPPRRPETPRPAAASGSGAPGGSGGGQPRQIQPLPGEPPLTLFRGKEVRELPPGSELDRFGTPNGNLTYAAGTPFEERSLVPEWVNRPYHIYRVQRPIEALAGVAIPWFNQPGGGAAYLLPTSVDELLGTGDLIELDPGEPPIE